MTNILTPDVADVRHEREGGRWTCHRRVEEERVRRVDGVIGVELRCG